MLRVSSLIDNGIGDNDQDATMALTELDKGLRSDKVGEQCDAIVRFPRLFERYPFPVLINASFLKLADVFRIGNNFLRFCVLRVCQQSEKHLDKISSVEEFVKRIFVVYHSNDPVGRALCLRTLGSLAGIIPENQQVHHCIRRSLDSHDNAEVEASIYAASQFAAQSKSFAISMCNKVSEMIQGQATPANMKLHLIPILQHMHHDTVTAAMVRKLCTDLLPSYPAQDFVYVTLNTLTQLASATLIDIPSQVILLLKYLSTDPRWIIKSQCLQHLYQLAIPGAHLWPDGAVDSIVNMALETKSSKVLNLSLRVIQVLSKSPSICAQNQSQTTILRQLCAKNSFHPFPNIAAQAIEILTEILCYGYNHKLNVEGEEDVISSLETLILILTLTDNKTTYQLKLSLKCCVRLSEAKTEHCDRFVELLGSRLGSVDGASTVAICEALGAIANLRSETLLSLLGDILGLLGELSTNIEDVPDSERQTHSKSVVMLSTLVFQTLAGYRWNAETKAVLKNVTSKNNLWANYRIARAAVRYSQHQMAMDVFGSLTEQVSSENWHFWLVALKEMSSAEAKLINEDNIAGETLMDRLDFAIGAYNKAIAALKAASTNTFQLTFQSEYMRLRKEFLCCLVQLLSTCNILCIVPPPAIANNIVQVTRDELQRHGYFTGQMRQCAIQFKDVGEKYGQLYETVFDADGATLENILVLQQMCVLLERSVETICTSPTSALKSGNSSVDWGNRDLAKLELRQLFEDCKKAEVIRQSITQNHTLQTVTHKQVDFLKTIIGLLSNTSLPVPRYFFQVLQSTSVKLSINPQPRLAGEFITVQTAGTQLAVKVEGVIQHGGARPGMYRKVAGVTITATSQLQQQAGQGSAVTGSKDANKNNGDKSTVLIQTVQPNKDFFSAQVLIAFPKGGQYVVSVDTALVDENQNTWKTGPKASISVKVPEEIKQMPILMPGMSNNANVILMTEDSLFIRPTQKKNM